MTATPPIDLAQLSALDTAAAVRDGRLTARAVVEAALARIAERDPALHAISVLRTERALADAEALDAAGPGHDGPLAGVPVAVKEELDVAGLVTTFGGLANITPAAQDCESVRRLRAAGAVVVAKTCMPEFGQFPFTESAARGSTHNPWDRTRSTGGSSGGSAAAVASGMVPVAMGGDGGGSIRIPASCCGLVGLKPTRGRVSTAPYASLWGALGTIGPLTRTVADSALVYDVLAGSTPADRWSAPPPQRPFLETATHDPGTLRIGWTTRSVVPGTRVDPQVAAATEATAQALAGLGHHVERFDPRWPTPTGAFLPQFYGAIREETGLVENPERLEWRTRSTARLGGWARPGVVAAAERSGERVAAALTSRLAGWDVLVTPTIAPLPPALGRLDGVGSLHAQLRSLPMVAFASILNVTGHPGISVPAGRSRQGWPIGVQLLTTTGDEGLLLAVAAQLERVRPWPLVAPA
jgi:amidase